MSRGTLRVRDYTQDGRLAGRWSESALCDDRRVEMNVTADVAHPLSAPDSTSDSIRVNLKTIVRANLNQRHTGPPVSDVVATAREALASCVRVGQAIIELAIVERHRLLPRRMGRL